MASLGRRTRVQWRPDVVAVLAAGRTIDEAAAAGAVSSRTVDRWLRDPEFRAAVHEARGALLEKAIGRAAALATEAIDTLGTIMRDPNSADAVRVSASRAVVDSSLRGREHLELVTRIAQLEQEFKARSADFGPAVGLPAIRSAVR